MRWRDAFFRKIGPGAFTGATVGSWLRILRDNRFSIDRPFWPRAAITTLGAVPNTIGAFLEDCWFGRAVDRTQIEPPLFVLGAWRSGTTHLHNLLSIDDRFAFPNLYHVTSPRTFLLFERATSRLIDRCIPRKRPQDNVKFGINEPQEEDFAICALTGQASMICMGFPRNVAFYERFLTMAELTTAELARWKNWYQYFLRKLTYKFRRPLVLKSPANTSRIKLLLEMFPGAKFVHIHRHPYDVIRSARHTLQTAGPWWQLQRTDYGDARMNDQLIRQLKVLYGGYFSQRTLIPPGRLYDVAFEHLDRDPLGEVRRVYDALQLPDFAGVEVRLVDYINSISDYKKNVLSPLPDSVQQQVHQECRQCFDEWGYAA
jgi:omega-hydroxy-beta-dihydromenaquinone-9 sulfotransferase